MRQVQVPERFATRMSWRGTEAPQVVRSALFQGTPLWEASLWARFSAV